MSGFKKPFRISPFPKGEQLSNGDTDGMSLVEEGTLKKYDYGKLSPNLASLLAEAHKDIKDFVNCGQSDRLNVSDPSSAGVNLFKPE
ncbi:hypothetical protein QJS10_CPB17g00469 [Acorus calamus]|uniref:Uncharacterized protein n=1 Tax=Acorus calamus TaxID=4465 RepID=A0AAV9CSA1_ACOCL|nr:hypothetical protein QJS10_CPB17g00469 [Acorus calamus]